MTKISYCSLGFDDRDIEGALDAVAAAGFEQTEILGQEPHLAVPPKGQALVDFRSRLESRRLSATVHAPLTTNVLGAPEASWRRDKVAVLAGYLEFSGEIGAEEMIVHPIPNPCFVPNPTAPDLPGRMREAVGRSLDELVPMAVRLGVRFLLENLPYDCDYPLLTLGELREAIKGYPARAVGLVIDTGHAALKGPGPAEQILAGGDRLFGTHLQDNDGSDDCHWVPSEGSIDWEAVRGALAAVDYAGPWTFEVHNGRNHETLEELAGMTLAVAQRWQGDS